MEKVLCAGSSFSFGLGLHFYNRNSHNIEYSYNLSEEERKSNLDNSYQALLANKLSYEYMETIGTGGANSDFLKGINTILNSIKNDNNIF